MIDLLFIALAFGLFVGLMEFCETGIRLYCEWMKSLDTDD